MPSGVGCSVTFVGHLFQQGGEYILCKYMKGVDVFDGIVISVEEGKDFVVFRELTNPVNEVALPNKVVDSNGKIKCHVGVYIINPSVCKECINLSKFTPTSKTSCNRCVHEATGEDNGTCSFCEEFNHFSLKEEVANKEYPEELAKEYQGIFDTVSKGSFCQGCKHIGVNTEIGPCNLCFEGMMHESDKAGTMENTAVADVGEKPSSLIETAKEFVKEMVPTTPSDPQYNARKKRCGKCANSSNPSACARCIDYSKFEPSRYR